MIPSIPAAARIGHRARRLGMLVALLALAALLGLAPGRRGPVPRGGPLPASAPAIPEPAGRGPHRSPPRASPPRRPGPGTAPAPPARPPGLAPRPPVPVPRPDAPRGPRPPAPDASHRALRGDPLLTGSPAPAVPPPAHRPRSHHAHRPVRRPGRPGTGGKPPGAAPPDAQQPRGDQQAPAAPAAPATAPPGRARPRRPHRAPAAPTRDPPPAPRRASPRARADRRPSRPPPARPGAEPAAPPLRRCPAGRGPRPTPPARPAPAGSADGPRRPAGPPRTPAGTRPAPATGRTTTSLSSMPRSAERGTSATLGARARQRGHGPEVVRHVHQPGREARELAGEQHHVVARAAGGLADPVAVGERRERHLRGLSQRMARVQHRVERLRVQRHTGQPRIVSRARPWYSTARARSASPSSTIGSEASPSASRTRGGCRVAPREPRDGRGQHLRDTGRERRDPHLTRRAVGVRGELRLGPSRAGRAPRWRAPAGSPPPVSAGRPGRCGSAACARSPAPGRRAAGRRRTA